MKRYLGGATERSLGMIKGAERMIKVSSLATYSSLFLQP